MSSSSSWKSILQRIIKLPMERQRLSEALGVTISTLNRWVYGDSQPQPSHLLRLLQVVQPQHRAELLAALEENYPDIQSWLKEDLPAQVSSAFFARVLRMRSTISPSLRFGHLSDLVLTQALLQLDPHQQGMALTIAQCMPPSHGGKIRSLRERVGKGTYPWPEDLEHRAIFLGMESLAGYAVETRHVVSVEDLRKQNQFLPAHRTEHEVSAAAQPIWLGGAIAGCLLASSTQPGHFTQPRLILLGVFSDMIALSFNRADFFPPRLIELRVMPDHHLQWSYISSFQQRARRAVSQATSGPEKHFHTLEIEQKVWQEIEHELLVLPV